MGKRPLSVQAVFDRALEIDSAAERKAFLDEVGAAAPEVYLEVAALLQAHEEAGSFLEQPACPPVVTTDGAGAEEESPETSRRGFRESFLRQLKALPAPWNHHQPGNEPGATGPLEPAPEAPPALPLPAIPGYELLAELGHGGMGVVFKARHVRLNRLVALKMIRAGPAADTEELARFSTEAEAVAR